MGGGVSKEDLDAQMHRVGELEQLIEKKTGDSDELQRQLDEAKKECVETQERQAYLAYQIRIRPSVYKDSKNDALDAL